MSNLAGHVTTLRQAVAASLREGIASRLRPHIPGVSERALAAMSPAISGFGGHAAAFAVAKALCHDFDLSMSEARTLFDEYNKRCYPLWSAKEITHKFESAGRLTSAKRAKGELRKASPAPAFRPAARIGILRTLKIKPRPPAQSGTLGTLVSESFIYGENQITEKTTISVGIKKNRSKRPNNPVFAFFIPMVNSKTPRRRSSTFNRQRSDL